MTALSFEITARSATCAARAGRVATPHGEFETPAFMPVGTRGTVKGVLPRDLADTGARVVLANTYHLLLRPGPDLIRRRGGLHAFMNWPGPILTDSGGYQVYSLGDTCRITDDGVAFKSVVDGSTIELTPERSIDVQHALGADIIMAFDDCPPSVDPRSLNATRRRLASAHSAGPEADHARRLDEANERTVRWLERCASRHACSGLADRQALFGIVQGGLDPDRRRWSAQRVCAIDLPGYAIGGVAVGEGPDQIERVVSLTAPLLPEDRPRYLMGVGYERDLVAAVRAGCDMFDCVLPTRNGRNANAFTRTGQVRLKNAAFAEDDRPIEPGCDCPACAGWGDAPRPFTRAYLRHLFLAQEMLGPILVSLHNLRHFQRLLLDIRAAIREDGWSALARRWPVVDPGSRGDAEPPDTPPSNRADAQESSDPC
ncbi:MAG: tRNA guanosine(34) transglycosylase Tgt [Planctomycetota bacterium]|nr:MAG: tRNA guanosine(34) transglycosylase Tgt [Planctomycetota bacterium]